MTDEELMRQMLEALELYQSKGSVQMFDDTAKALRDRLERFEQKPYAWTYQNVYTDSWYLTWEKQTGGRNWTPLYTAPPSKPDDLLRQSEKEGWRWAKECEAEVKRLRTLLAESGQGCSECGVTVSEGYALYCVKCVEPLFAKEKE